MEAIIPAICRIKCKVILDNWHKPCHVALIDEGLINAIEDRLMRMILIAAYRGVGPEIFAPTVPPSDTLFEMSVHPGNPVWGVKKCITPQIAVVMPTHPIRFR